MSHHAALRVMVVGVGHWHARRYLETVISIGERLVAVWDADDVVAQAVASEFATISRPDLLHLIASQSPDVIIAMAEHAHMPALLEILLTTPAALILEKPLGIDPADLSPLVVEAERKNRFAAVTFINRFTPFWGVQRELAEAGRLGNVCYASLRLINGSPQRYVNQGVDWMLDPARAGGGCLINLGTHLLDAFLQIAGGEVSVDAVQLGYAAYGLPVEDHALAMLRGSEGVTGHIETGYCYAGLSGGDMEWRLITSNAYLCQRPEGLIVQTLDDGLQVHRPVPSSAQTYHHFIVDTLDAIRQGRPPVADLHDGLRVLELVQSIYTKGRASSDG